MGQMDPHEVPEKYYNMACGVEKFSALVLETDIKG